MAGLIRPLFIRQDEACKMLGLSRYLLREFEQAGLIRALRTPRNQRRYLRIDIINLAAKL